MPASARAIPLSVVVPVLNEAAGIRDCLGALQEARAAGVEVIVCDGGSRDDTLALAAPLADRVLIAPRGRGSQMNAGAAAARGEVLLFLHADTRLPAGWLVAVRHAVAAGATWGRFDVRISGGARMLRVVAALMNVRSRLTGIATGDQAVFVTREGFWRVGGYPDIALMEDIALSAALKRETTPACLRLRAVTCGRRWETQGVVRTVLRMWLLRLRYWLGADPASLARAYGYVPRIG